MKNRNEIVYVSLYEYLGRSIKNSDDGYKVSELAQEKGIKPKYRILPEELQTDKYKSVATYPIDFLDSIYKRSDQVIVRKDELYEVLNRIQSLETKLEELLNVTNKYESDDDDLPF